MSHTISDIDHYSEGESLTWEFTVNEDGSAKDITGASIEWYLLDDPDDDSGDAVLDHDSTGVSASVTDAAAGRFDVAIERDVTTGQVGAKWHRVVLDDASTGRQVWDGPFNIEPA